MDLRSLILITTLLAAALSGCISAKEEDPSPPQPDAQSEADTPPEPPVPAVKEIHSVSWVGQRLLDERFTVPEGYDYVATQFWNTGQLIGHPVLEDGDGTEMDDPFSSFTGGVYRLFRLMPATPGGAQLTIEAGPALDGAVLGVGGFDAVAIAGATPGDLFTMSWAGQRLEPVILDTQVLFYMPPDVERFAFQLGGSGQTTVGFQLHDPDGETMLTYGPQSGPQSDRHVLGGKEGLWTLTLEGMTNGVWTLSADTITDDQEDD